MTSRWIFEDCRLFTELVPYCTSKSLSKALIHPLALAKTAFCYGFIFKILDLEVIFSFALGNSQFLKTTEVFGTFTEFGP